MEIKRLKETYRINVAEVPRQRPCTPEEATIVRAVERMAPCCLEESQSGSYGEKPTLLCAECGITFLKTRFYEVD